MSEHEHDRPAQSADKKPRCLILDLDAHPAAGPGPAPDSEEARHLGQFPQAGAHAGAALAMLSAGEMLKQVASPLERFRDVMQPAGEMLKQFARSPAGEMLMQIASSEERFRADLGPPDQSLPWPPLLDPSKLPSAPGLDALQRIEAKLDQVMDMLKLLLEKQGQKGIGEPPA